MGDMTNDVFSEQPFGKIAIEKISKNVGKLPENFRLYEAGWIGDRSQLMRVTGAQFRKAKKGKYKGLLSVLIPKTKQVAYITAEEINSVL